MKTQSLLATLTLFTCALAQADQIATLKCVGPNATLEVRSPYLGENSEMAQKLYILKRSDSTEGESEYTAYFLNVEEDIGGARTGGAGSLVFTGTNEVGGRFQLIIAPWTDASNGSTIHQVSGGELTYNHSPLKGEQKPVTCTQN